MGRLVGSQGFGHTDRTATRATTAVRDGEGLVEVEVTDVCTDEAWIGESYLSVHVRPIHVDESTAVVDTLAEVDDIRLEDPVGTGVGDHHRSKLILVLLGLLHEVFPVDITMLVTGDDHALIATLRGGGRVRPVCRGGEKYLVPMATAMSFVVRADGAKTCIFACCTRVRLERDDGESGDGR